MSPYKGVELNENQRVEMLEVLDFLQQDIVIGSPVKKSTEFKPAELSMDDLSKLPKSFFNYFEISVV